MNFGLRFALFLLLSCTSLPAFAIAEENKPAQELVLEEKSSSEKEPSILDSWNKDNVSREKAEDEKFSALWSKTMVLLAIAIGILFIATWIMKHFDRFKPKTTPQNARIQLIEKRMLSQKSCVYLLDIDGHKIVITESVNGTQSPYELKKTLPG